MRVSLVPLCVCIFCYSLLHLFPSLSLVHEKTDGTSHATTMGWWNWCRWFFDLHLLLFISLLMMIRWQELPFTLSLKDPWRLQFLPDCLSVSVSQVCLPNIKWEESQQDILTPCTFSLFDWRGVCCSFFLFLSFLAQHDRMSMREQGAQETLTRNRDMIYDATLVSSRIRVYCWCGI